MTRLIIMAILLAAWPAAVQASGPSNQPKIVAPGLDAQAPRPKC